MALPGNGRDLPAADPPRGQGPRPGHRQPGGVVLPAHRAGRPGLLSRQRLWEGDARLPVRGRSQEAHSSPADIADSQYDRAEDRAHEAARRGPEDRSRLRQRGVQRGHPLHRRARLRRRRQGRGRPRRVGARQHLPQQPAGDLRAARPGMRPPGVEGHRVFGRLLRGQALLPDLQPASQDGALQPGPVRPAAGTTRIPSVSAASPHSSRALPRNGSSCSRKG